MLVTRSATRLLGMAEREPVAKSHRQSRHRTHRGRVRQVTRDVVTILALRRRATS